MFSHFGYGYVTQHTIPPPRTHEGIDRLKTVAANFSIEIPPPK